MSDTSHHVQSSEFWTLNSGHDVMCHHVEQLGDGHLWLLRRQGLRHRLLLQALLRAARASNRPIAVPGSVPPATNIPAYYQPLHEAPSFPYAPRSRPVRVCCLAPQGSPCVWGAAMEKAGLGSCFGCCLGIYCCCPCVICQVGNSDITLTRACAL